MILHTCLRPVLLLAVASLFVAYGCSDTGSRQNTASDDPAPPSATAHAQLQKRVEWYEAVGTVRPKTETTVEAQITGRVLEVLVRPGESVDKEELLVRLDSRESAARLERTRKAVETASSGVEQARQLLAAATAAFEKAESTYRRMEALHRQQVITQEELEESESAYLQARAERQRARSGLEQARSRLEEARAAAEETRIGKGYTDIVSQVDGEVAKRYVDPGDLAFPGKALLSIQTSGTLRLEARVREGAIGKVRLGMELPVIIPSLGAAGHLSGTVEEVEPLADPGSRTFQVKVGLPPVPDLYPGMFGNLHIALGERPAVLVPARAVRSVGQLDTVRARLADGWQTIYVKTGTTEDGMTEILSGLSGGEEVALPEQAPDNSLSPATPRGDSTGRSRTSGDRPSHADIPTGADTSSATAPSGAQSSATSGRQPGYQAVLSADFTGPHTGNARLDALHDHPSANKDGSA